MGAVTVKPSGSGGTDSRQGGQPEPPTSTPHAAERALRALFGVPERRRPRPWRKASASTRPAAPRSCSWESLEVGEPGPGEVRVRHVAVGLNFADTYFRTGLYPAPLPAGMGVEAAGVIEAVGPGVTDFAEGDRVTYTGSPLGAYSTERVMAVAPADQAARRHPVRDRRRDDDARADLRRTCCAASRPLDAGDTVLLHAAAGGVGLIFTPVGAACSAST